MAAVTKVWGWCQIAFGDTWQTAEQTWTDVTNYLREFDLSWGRGSEYDQFRAGTCTVMLDNRDRRFEPEYTSGAYFPNVKPWVPLKVGVAFTDGSNTTSQCLFSGFVERWVLEYPGFGADSTVQVQCSDSMKVVNQYEVTVTTASTTPGGEIDDVLDAVGWSTGSLWRTVDAGMSAELAASTVEDAAALTAVNTIALSDGGWFYSMPHSTAHTPRLVFRDRGWPLENNTVQATFGETSSYTRYTDLQLPYAEERVRNRWKIGIAASTKTAVANSTNSQDLYGLRVYSQTGLLLKTTGEADERALAGLHTTATPSYTATLTAPLRAGMDYDRAVDLAVDAYGPLQWVAVRRGGIEQEMIVDGCSVSFQVGGVCEFTYTTSPAGMAGEYWELADSALGKLDETAYLGW